MGSAIVELVDHAPPCPFVHNNYMVTPLSRLVHGAYLLSQHENSTLSNTLMEVCYTLHLMQLPTCGHVVKLPRMSWLQDQELQHENKFRLCQLQSHGS